MKAEQMSHKEQINSDTSFFDQRSEVDEGYEIFQHAEAQIRLPFSQAPTGMAIVGLDHRLLRVNKALCDALGYSQRELIEHSLIGITHPDDAGKVKDMARQLFRGEIPSYRMDKRFITKDGQLVWLDLTALLIRDSQNNPLYGLTMAEDITKRKRTEEALRTSEERYRSFIVNSSEGIWRLESERPIDTSLPVDEQSEMFYKYSYLAECNDTLARMFSKQSADDLIGVRFDDLQLAPVTSSRASVRLFIENNYRLQNFESVVTEADGSKRYFINNVIGIVINGYLLRAWGTRHDDTERRLVEEEVKSSRQRMRALAAHLQSVREQERIDIAREMHDVLGQDLTSLKMDLAWLNKRLTNAADESMRAEMAGRLKGATCLLDETIAAVKNLSAEMRPGVLDKFGLPAAIEWQCQEFSRRTGLPCECHLPEEDARFDGERLTALYRILQEALTNVARHSAATCVDVELKISDARATLVVRDDGKGITEDEASAQTSLGLLGMSERAEMLGGSLAINGRPGKGTTITASIPLTAPQ
jgi:PAS domain S-box-containing protein